jgi:drug/metabolite transporter (DMT)-like permease
MERWSSLIGIVTALIGNVLISVALNIQRYAHIRITREWEQNKIKKEAERRRTRSGASSVNQYGTVGCDGRGRSREQDRHNGHGQFEAYRDDEDAHPRETHGTRGSSGRDSFASDSTARPEDSDDRKSYLRSPYWWAGIILMVLGETGNFLAYGFAPASIVSPLGVVALISNCVIAPCLLKEKFRQRDFWGVLVAIAGAVVVVLSARSSSEKIGPGEIWMMITRWEFELYLGLTIGLIIGLMWASFSYGSRSILIDVGLVALFGKSVLVTKYDKTTILTVFIRWIHGFVYQGRLFIVVRHIMACHYIPHYLPACFRSCLQRLDANTVHQPSPAAL